MNKVLLSILYLTISIFCFSENVVKSKEFISYTDYFKLPINDKVKYLFEDYPKIERIDDTATQPKYYRYASYLAYEGHDVVELIIPYLDVMSFDNYFKDPYQLELDKTAAVILYLRGNNFLTSDEILYFKNIFQNKLNNYIEKYHIIDMTVWHGEILLSEVTGESDYKNNIISDFLLVKYKSIGFKELQVSKDVLSIESEKYP